MAENARRRKREAVAELRDLVSARGVPVDRRRPPGPHGRCIFLWVFQWTSNGRPMDALWTSQWTPQWTL